MQDGMITVLMSLELYEVLLLILLSLGLVPVTFQYREYRNKWFYSAYLLFLTGTVATVLEHLMFPAVLNLVEHGIGIMLSGLLFWLTAMYSAEDVIDERDRKRWQEVLSP